MDRKKRNIALIVTLVLMVVISMLFPKVYSFLSGISLWIIVIAIILGIINNFKIIRMIKKEDKKENN